MRELEILVRGRPSAKAEEVIRVATKLAESVNQSLWRLKKARRVVERVALLEDAEARYFALLAYRTAHPFLQLKGAKSVGKRLARVSDHATRLDHFRRAGRPPIGFVRSMKAAAEILDAYPIARQASLSCLAAAEAFVDA